MHAVLSINEGILDKSILPKVRILTGTTILGQSGPKSNDNEEALNIFQIFSIRYRLVSYPEPSVLKEILPFYREYSQFILSCADKMDRFNAL